MTDATVAVSGSRLQPGSWQHVALTYDGALLRLYVDGQLAGSTPATGSVTNGDGPLRIGGVAGQYFAGTLDDVRVYNRALSSADIVADMAAPVTGTPGNAPPSADIQADCVALDCTFNGNGSTEGDGTIVDYVWDFGDGASASGRAVKHTYASGGTFTVQLTVLDDSGGADIGEREVVVTASSAPIALLATGYKQRGVQFADLHWSGAEGAVDVYRDGNVTATNVAGSELTEEIGGRGGGTYSYQVCETGGTTICSDEVTIQF